MSAQSAGRVVTLLLASLLLAGCAGRLEEGDSSLKARGSGVGVVTAGEIEASGTRNALDALRRLRPELLIRRNDAVASADPYRGYAVVYLNGVLQGGVDVLGTIPVAAITEIRYVSSTAGADRFGKRHPGGVIAVSTRK
jgi:hypothetical protein